MYASAGIIGPYQSSTAAECASRFATHGRSLNASAKGSEQLIYKTPNWPHDLTDEQRLAEERAVDLQINAICGRLAKRIRAKLLESLNRALPDHWWN